MKSSYTFTLNFSELSRNHSAEYNFISPPGSFLPTPIYKSSPGGEMTFSVLIDLSEIENKNSYLAFSEDGSLISLGDVGIDEHLSFFESLVLPDAFTFIDSRSKWTAPSRLIFGVGQRTWNVVCTTVAQRETLYTRQLAPFRAVVAVTLKQIFTGESEMLAYMEKVRAENLGVVQLL
jgi:hypothetical protein